MTAHGSGHHPSNNRNRYQVPVNVLRTASGPDNVSEPFIFFWDATSATDQFSVFMHFAEVEKLQPDQSRKFNIYLNGRQRNDQPLEPPYLALDTIEFSSVVTGNTRHTISLNKTENSTHPPIINAYEIYTVKKFSNSGTNETDVSAILNIKSAYKVIKNWQGDPCEPEDFLWDGLKCIYPSSNHSARIISLNLSTSQLTGEIVSSIANLTQLKTLDLSNNNLSGQVPEFLSLLPLSVLDLKGNKFTGPIPAQLLENQKKRILSLSYDGSGDENKNSKKIPAVVGIVIGSVLLAAILFGIWITRGRVMRVFKKSGKQLQASISDIERKDRPFTYSQVLDITKNLQEKLGEGSYSKVYLGSVGDNEVAVKILESPQTTKIEFKNEVSLLRRAHHKNLTSMVGYCNEDPYMVIIYEYMAGRNLHEYLSGNSRGISSWVERLQIALDAAQGLEYMHHGCKPAIIHRDVKTTNILLNKQFRAKLADFGLSKAYPAEGGTHVSTVHVAGTPGYIDPDCYLNTKKLSEKSDVFSFGVVLLVVITGQPPILNEHELHISQWVDSNFQRGDATKVVDSRFGGNYDVNSVRIAVELALSCTSGNSSTRPTMKLVVSSLNECLAIEICNHEADPNNDSEGITRPLHFRGANA